MDGVFLTQKARNISYTDTWTVPVAVKRTVGVHAGVWMKTLVHDAQWAGHDWEEDLAQAAWTDHQHVLWHPASFLH